MEMTGTRVCPAARNKQLLWRNRERNALFLKLLLKGVSFIVCKFMFASRATRHAPPVWQLARVPQAVRFSDIRAWAKRLFLAILPFSLGHLLGSTVQPRFFLHTAA
jgi:hypothetical protein